MMSTKEFAESLCMLVAKMGQHCYPKWLIQTTLGFIRITPREKTEAMLNEFHTLAEQGLEEMEFHHEINKVFRKYKPKPHTQTEE